MKKYYSKTFIKKLKKIDVKLRERIMNAISKIPQEGDIKKLRGQKLKNIFRLRIGKYRIIFLVKENEIYVLDVDSRGAFISKSFAYNMESKSACRIAGSVFA